MRTPPPYKTENYTFFYFVFFCFFSRLSLFLEMCKCRGSPVQIGEQNNQSSVRRNSHMREIWTQGTATHNASAICSFISLEHPFLVQALKLINIHATFINGSAAHGFGVSVSETARGSHTNWWLMALPLAAKPRARVNVVLSCTFIALPHI